MKRLVTIAATILLAIPALAQVAGYNVPETGIGLTIYIGPGKIAKNDGTVVSYAGGTLNLSASATNYGYVDSTGTPQVNTTGVPAGDYPLFRAVTARVAGADQVTSVTDLRADVFFPVTPARMVWTPYINGSLNTNNTHYSYWIPGAAITVTRVFVSVEGTNPTCTVAPKIRVTDGTNNVDVSITGAQQDSGAVSQNFAAGVEIDVNNVAGTCTTAPTNGMITIEYVMQ